MKPWLAVVLLSPCLAAAATPEPVAQAWSIDAAQSQAQFSVRKFWFTRVHGTFPALRGTLQRSDTKLGEALATVNATLEVAKLEMDDAGNRRHALGPSFFDAERFPRVRFDAEPFPLTELASGGVLHGMLTLHGERRAVEFELLPSECPPQPLACAIRVRGNISRAAFGMRKWRGVLSDNVELDLRIALRAPLPAPPRAGPPESG